MTHLPSNPSEPGSGDQRRSTGRRQQWLQSSVGPVLDLSLGGMKVLTKRPIDGEITIDLWTIVGKISIRGDVVWSQRLGFRRHMAGVEFLQLDDETKQRLAEASSKHAPRLQPVA